MSDGSVIQAIESTCAAVSLIACLCMGIKIRREGTSNIANKMLSFLFVLDFILALAYVVGRAAMPIDGFCQFQVHFTVELCCRKALNAFQLAV